MTSPPEALVDANVILRFVTRAPAHQAEAAARLFARAQRGDVVLSLLPLVVAEVVYVLTRVYGYDSERVQLELAELFDTDCLRISEEASVRRALARRVTTPIDFVDAYLGEKARHEGLTVASFDRDFDRFGVPRLDLT